MKKSIIKLVVVLLVVMLAFTAVATISNAEEQQKGASKVTLDEAKDVSKATENAQDTSGAASSINNIIKAMITIVQVVGVGVAIIMLIVLAIKYISAAPGDKADIKKHAVVYVVGAIVLFAASGILGIIKNFAGNVTEG